MGGADIGFMISTSPFDIGIFGSISKPVGCLAKGKATLGVGYDSDCRSDFDGVGFEFTGGYKSIGGSLSLNPNSNSYVPVGGTIEVGPQLGVEENMTVTGSLTVRDMGRAFGRPIYVGGGGQIIGE